MPDIFSTKNLAAKQIWHITAPPSVPISSLKEITVQDIGWDKKLISHKDADYALVEGGISRKSPQYILIPSDKESIYRPTTKSIGRALHLHQLLSTTDSTMTQAMAAGEARPAFKVTKTSAHRQPAGLKMRYRPFGDTRGKLGASNLDGSSSEGDWRDGQNITKRQFRMPVGLSSTEIQKKRKPSTAAGGADTTKQLPKEKRPRRADINSALNSNQDIATPQVRSDVDGADPTSLGTELSETGKSSRSRWDFSNDICEWSNDKGH